MTTDIDAQCPTLRDREEPVHNGALRSKFAWDMEDDDD